MRKGIAYANKVVSHTIFPKINLGHISKKVENHFLEYHHHNGYIKYNMLKCSSPLFCCNFVKLCSTVVYFGKLYLHSFSGKHLFFINSFNKQKCNG